jgi:zinc protease
MPGISIRHPDYHALLILNHVFSQAGSGGRLGRRLRDAEGLAATVRSQFDANLAEGPFVVRAAVSPARVEQAVELIRQEAHKIKERSVTEEEVVSAKKALIHGLPVELESNEAVAGQLLAMELYLLGEDYLQRYPELIGSVSLRALQDCARNQFAFERAALVIAGPQQGH